MTSWGVDVRRLAIVLAATSTLGFTANALSRHPVPLLAPSGPGAWLRIEPRIAVDELAAELQSGRLVLILDVRSKEEFGRGHATNSLHAPAKGFRQAYETLGLARILPAADRVVVLCDSAACPTADRVARILVESGHREVRVLQGGWTAYVQSGLERR